jgi:hypothetical protein
MSDPAVRKRLDQAVAFLDAVMAACWRSKPPAPRCTGPGAFCAMPTAVAFRERGRSSWTLPPEDLLDAASIPSLWRVSDIGRRAVLLAVVGGFAVDHLLRADPNVHHRLAHARRKRKPQVRYPLRR